MKKLVTMILDETGSMQSIKPDVVGGYNEYINQLKQEEGDLLFTLIKFDSQHRTVVHSAKPIKEVPELTDATYTPGSLTPLYDAMMTGIRDAEKHAEEGDRVVVAIFTDGLENCSKEANVADVKSLVAEKEKAGWFFSFLGVGIEAFPEAANMGISMGQTLKGGRGKSREVWANAAASQSRYTHTGSTLSAEYTDEERKRSE